MTGSLCVRQTAVQFKLSRRSFTRVSQTQQQQESLSFAMHLAHTVLLADLRHSNSQVIPLVKQAAASFAMHGGSFAQREPIQESPGAPAPESHAACPGDIASACFTTANDSEMAPRSSCITAQPSAIRRCGGFSAKNSRWKRWRGVLPRDWILLFGSGPGISEYCSQQSR
jgi:hypothetical protein